MAQGVSRRQAWALPNGLCGSKADHAPHSHASKTLGLFWCSADQTQREPNRSEARRDGR